MPRAAASSMPRSKPSFNGVPGTSTLHRQSRTSNPAERPRRRFRPMAPRPPPAPRAALPKRPPKSCSTRCARSPRSAHRVSRWTRTSSSSDSIRSSGWRSSPRWKTFRRPLPRAGPRHDGNLPGGRRGRRDVPRQDSSRQRRSRACRSPAGELPLRSLPRVPGAQAEYASALRHRTGESVLQRPRTRHQRHDGDRRPGDDQLLELQLSRHVGRPRRRARPRNKPSTATAPASRPAGWSPAKSRCTASWSAPSPIFSASKMRSASSAAIRPTKRRSATCSAPAI